MMSSAEEDSDVVALLEENGKTGSGNRSGKTKRVRQRVDAGEPRNSYASIPNFSSRPPPGALSIGGFVPHHFPTNGFTSKMLCDLLGATRPLPLSKDRQQDPMILTDSDAGLNGSTATSPNGRLYLNGSACPDMLSSYGPLSRDSPERCSSEGSSSSSGSSNSHLLRDILQQGRKQRGGEPTTDGNGGHGPENARDSVSCSGSKQEEKPEESRGERMSVGGGTVTASPPPSPASSCGSPSGGECGAPWATPAESTLPTALVSNGINSSLEVKRARVETIVSNMLQVAPRGNGVGNGPLDAPQMPVNGCKKRKLYQPQQHDASTKMTNGDASSLYDDEEEMFDDGPASKQQRRSNGNGNVGLFTFRQQLRQMQQQLVAMQQQYMEMMDGDSSEDDETQPSKSKNHDSDAEDHKPRIDHKQEVSRSLKPYMDYDNASMYDEQRRLVIDDDDQKETSACEDDNPKSEIHRQSCIVQPSGSPPDLDIDWLAESIKAELSTSLAQVVDAVVSRCRQKALGGTKLPARNNSANTNGNSAPIHEQDVTKDPTLLSQMLDRKSPRTKVIDRGTRVNGLCGLRTSPYPPAEVATAPKPPFFFPLKPPASVAATAAFLYGSPPHPLPTMGTYGGGSSPLHSTPTPQQDAPEQTEAMSLVVTPKKKRHKVTDTRLNQGRPTCGGLPVRNQDNTSQDATPPKYLMPEPMPMATPHMYSHHHAPPPPPPLVPVSLPTTVAIPNPSLNQSDLFHNFAYDHHRLSAHYAMSEPQDDDGPPMGLHHSMAMHPLLSFHGHQRGSPDSLHISHMKQDSGDMSDAGDSPAYDSSMPMISFLPMHTSTLTPMHLRKAKLMFFYARYPSSAVLKMYFPDIKFNKNNTAQLVKWFSNFREFFYIQMEKYARQAMSEGIKTSDDLKVNADSELLRVLNLHYNRNNHIEAPENFRYVVEQTLREFYKALVAGKDSEQSWKKSIYKIIARMDDNVPEYFKSPNFLETLE